MDVRAWVVLLGIGLLSGALWIIFIGLPARYETNYIPFGEIPVNFYILGLITSCVVAPLFEEKVVRHLLLDGVSHYFGRVLSIIMVSVVFAEVHVGAVTSSFFYSILLCICVHSFRLGTVQRSIIHGAINLAITQWVIFYPTPRDYYGSYP
ncbi:CAAX amino terminal protease self- immunity [compost metagenome]